MRVQILVYDGYDEADALGPLSVFARAAAHGADFRAELVRLGSGTVTSAYGLTLHVATRLDAERAPGLLVVPGAHWLATAAENAWAAGERRRIAAAVAAVHASGAITAAVDTGALVLASAGLLQGRPATARPGVVDELRTAGAEIVNAPVVDDGTVVTSRGATAGLDVALWLVERIAEPVGADTVAREVAYERRGDVWRRPI